MSITISLPITVLGALPVFCICSFIISKNISSTYVGQGVSPLGAGEYSSEQDKKVSLPSWEELK